MRCRGSDTASSPGGAASEGLSRDADPALQASAPRRLSERRFSELQHVCGSWFRGSGVFAV